jgi:hypothetical protein
MEIKRRGRDRVREMLLEEVKHKRLAKRKITSKVRFLREGEGMKQIIMVLTLANWTKPRTSFQLLKLLQVLALLSDETA